MRMTKTGTLKHRLLAAAFALVCSCEALAQAQSFQYFYDDLGQLIKVIDSSGNEIDYQYDAVGNILQITRTTAPGSGVLAVLDFTPQQGGVGETVTIQGQNFSTTPGANIVKFNGTPTTVTAATATSLTVTVPSSATTGPITVSVGTSTATSSLAFNVLPLPVILSISRKSALFGTSFSNIKVTGSNFTGATFAFQPSFVSVVNATVTSSSSATLSITVGTTAGTLALVATNFAGSSSSYPVANNRFTVVNPASTALSASGFPDVIEAIFGDDPLDPNSVPNPNLSPSGEVGGTFSVLNTAGANGSQPVSMEADTVPYSVLNLAGVTGGQPMAVEADAVSFSVLNTAGSPGGGSGGGGTVPLEADTVPFSVLNLAGVSGNQPMQMEADAITFSVLNTAGSGGGGGGGGGTTPFEADGLTFSVLNLAGVSGNQPMEMEADGVPFSVQNGTAPMLPRLPNAPAPEKPARPRKKSNTASPSPSGSNSKESGGANANPNASAEQDNLQRRKRER
jgi:YD repeat-containing protein